LTVSVRAALLAVALVGETLLATGTGGTAGVMVKVTVPDVPPPGAGVTTLTGTDFAAMRSEAVIAARS
jgi:hypothetical protein